MSETAHLGKREQERQLDAAANPLDVDTDIGFREACRIIGRALGYLSYFKVRFALKCFFVSTALLTPLILPWPIKIVIDNVVLGRTIDPGAFPAYFVPFVEFLDGRTPSEMMVWIVVLGAVMVVLFGSFGEGAATDETRVGLAQGHDAATQTENQANMAHSKFAGLVGFVEYRLQLRLSQALNHLLRAQLFERIQAMPLTLLNDQRIGDSLYRVMYDTAAIGNVVYQVLMAGPTTIFSAIVVLYVMTTTYGDSPEVVWLASLILPLQVLAILLFPRLLRRRSQASRAAGAATTANIEEGMSNVLAIQSLGGNAIERRRFHDASQESFKRHRSELLVQILLGVSRAAATGVIGFVAFYVISGAVIEGRLTPGDYGVLFFYYGWLAGTLAYLPYIWPRIQASVPGIRRVFFLMDQPSELERAGSPMPAIREGIRLTDVSFAYPDGRDALQHIDLTAEVGEVTALVGPTGAGKTTLGLVIAGLYEASEGVVAFDGRDLREHSVASVRSQVSFVFQEPQLFSMSIIDNIRYVNPSATRAEVERVARLAGAHEFISRLPEGYETPLGTVTSKLSVGQKQRIAIARGLLKESTILILDEPTSALDPETEAYLVEALQDAARHKLVLVIAHRLSTIAHADQIVFLDTGRIVERGTHQALMERPDGHYRRYVETQT